MISQTARPGRSASPIQFLPDPGSNPLPYELPGIYVSLPYPSYPRDAGAHGPVDIAHFAVATGGESTLGLALAPEAEHQHVEALPEAGAGRLDGVDARLAHPCRRPAPRPWRSPASAPTGRPGRSRRCCVASRPRNMRRCPHAPCRETGPTRRSSTITDRSAGEAGSHRPRNSRSRRSGGGLAPSSPSGV